MGRARQSVRAAVSASPRRHRGAEPDYEGWSLQAAANASRIAAARRTGDWVPGASGTERPFRTLSGARLLWCWRPATGEHAYYNCDTDLILTDEEAAALRGEHSSPRFVPSVDARRDEAAAYLPARRDDERRALNLHRFNEDTAPGAVFTDVDSIHQLLDLAIRQRGSLQGDDRALLASVGVDAPLRLSATRRYVAVRTEGLGEVVDAAGLDPRTPVVVEPGRDGQLELVADADVQGQEFVGVIEFGYDEDGVERVVDAYPGLPVESLSGAGYASGQRLTVGELLRHAPPGERRVWLRLRSRAVKPAPVERPDAFSGLLGFRRGVR